MAKLTVRDVEDIGNAQYRCTFEITDEKTKAIIGSGEHYIVASGARHGLGPRIWALIEAKKFEGSIKPFVPPAE